MLQLLRLLLASGLLPAIRARLIDVRYPTARLLQGGAAALLIGWVVIIADGFLPVMAVAPVGLIAFVLATAVSIASNVVATLCALAVVYRRSRTATQTPVTGGQTAVAVLIVALAVVSFVGERVLSLVVAVNG